MTLWFVFALMTAVAIFAVLLPLGLTGRSQGGGDETSVYKDQLAEIERDVAAGLIGAAEAGAARVEIGRRLLAAADKESGVALQSNARLRRLAAVLALVGLPAVAVALYLPLGSPRLGDFPLAAMSDKRTRGIFKAWRERLALSSRRQADYAVSARLLVPNHAAV